MSIILKTDNTCIESAAKKAYEALIKQALKSDLADCNSLDTQIEGLKFFLEQADFQTLRSEYPELDKGGATQVTLEFDVSGVSVMISFTDHRILVTK